jgi:hypothetical protein
LFLRTLDQSPVKLVPRPNDVVWLTSTARRVFRTPPSESPQAAPERTSS